MADAPVFITADLDTILSEWLSDYESKTGKTLEPGHPEYALISASAYREYLLRVQVQNACLQNLVDFANAPMLDYLGALVKVYRHDSLKAKTVIEFTKDAGGGDLLIPKGTTVSDGTNMFQTIANLTILDAHTSGYRTAEAVIPGPSQNGLAPGAWILEDSVPRITAVNNTIATFGGDGEESDESLRERIKEGPSQYSTAGSENAYKFWTKTLQPLIIDVDVQASNGIVTIYPLMYDQSDISSGMAEDLKSQLSGDNIRPLTDTIEITAATKLTESVQIDIWIFEGVDYQDVVMAITTNMDEYTKQRRETLGLDAIDDQIKATCMVTGVYDIDLTGGFVNQIAASNEFVDLDYIIGLIQIADG